MLTQLRLDVTAKLEEAGIRSVEYIAETITPPIAVPVPGEPYIVQESGDQGVPFGRLTVRIDVLVISHRGTNKKAAAGVDSLVWDVIAALNSDWDIERVSQPGEVTLSGARFMGSVVSISQWIKEP